MKHSLLLLIPLFTACAMQHEQKDIINPDGTTTRYDVIQKGGFVSPSVTITRIQDCHTGSEGVECVARDFKTDGRGALEALAPALAGAAIGAGIGAAGSDDTTISNGTGNTAIDVEATAGATAVSTSHGKR